MKNLFRSRLSQQLTLSQITKLSSQSNLSPGEVEKWYERFIVCYTYGYVSFEEFLIYIKQLNIYHGNLENQLSKSMMKQLFYTLDLDKDKQLNFEEFFRFNLLINQESVEDKLKFILNSFNQQKTNYYTKQELVNILTNMFLLLDISKPSIDLSQRIDRILMYINLYNESTKICWNTFCTSVLNHSILHELLLSSHFDNENFENTILTI